MDDVRHCLEPGIHLEGYPLKAAHPRHHLRQMAWVMTPSDGIY